MVPLVRYCTVARHPGREADREGQARRDRRAHQERRRRGRRAAEDRLGVRLAGALGDRDGRGAPARTRSACSRARACSRASTASTGLYVGVPCVIGAGGVERVLEVELDAEERKLFDASRRARAQAGRPRSAAVRERPRVPGEGAAARVRRRGARRAARHHAGRGRGGGARARRAVVVVKAQVHAGGRGKAGGIKLAKSPAEAKQVASEILGMTLRHAPDRARGQARAQGLRRGGLRRSRASSTSRSLLDRAGREARGHRLDRGRHGDRGGRGDDAGEDPHRARRPGRRPPGPTRRGASASALGLDARAGRAARRVPRGALPALRREGRLARRDQSAGRDRGGRSARARRQAQLRRQRALPPPRRRASCATPTRRTRASARRRRSTSPTSASTATSAAW